MNTSRSPVFGDFNETLATSYQTRTAQAFGEIGYRAAVGDLEINPFVSGAYMAVRGSAFEENGGSAALSGSAASRNLGLTVTGMRVSTDFGLGEGKLSTSATLGWQHLYGRTQGTADVAFAGGTPFEIEGAGLARDAVRIELSANYLVSERMKLGLSYRGALARSSSSSSIRGDFKLAF